MNSPALEVMGQTFECGIELASAEKRTVHARARS